MTVRNDLGEEKCSGYRRAGGSPLAQTGEMAEAEIIHRAKHGDATAFEALYKSHSGRVYALCFRMLGNTGDAEDLTQEAFLQVFRKIHTFRGESTFSTWLHRLAVNIVLMRLRRKPPTEISLEQSNKPLNASKESNGETGGPDLSLIGAIDRIWLEWAIKQLPACHKLVFELHHVQGYKHKEIAQMMDCSVGTSKSQLHRARRRLRELLREKLGLGWIMPTEANGPPLTAM